jgi:protein phosphatase
MRYADGMSYRSAWPLHTRVAVAARADIGRMRMHMEDSFLVADLAEGAALPPPVFSGVIESGAGVALAALDAMGASREGMLAALVSGEALRASLSAAPLPDGDDDRERRLGEAMSAANRAIADAIAQDPHQLGMGCAATLAVIAGDRLHLAQVGDSRAYVLRAGHLVQVTRDDSLVCDAIVAGCSRAQVEALPEQVITKALGSKEVVEARTATVPLRAGDVILVCSDGLTNEIDDRAIERTLARITDLDEACLALIHQALRAGGNDNLTVILARPEGDFLRAPGPGDALVSAQPVTPLVP